MQHHVSYFAFFERSQRGKSWKCVHHSRHCRRSRCCNHKHHDHPHYCHYFANKTHGCPDLFCSGLAFVSRHLLKLLPMSLSIYFSAISDSVSLRCFRRIAPSCTDSLERSCPVFFPYLFAAAIQIIRFIIQFFNCVTVSDVSHLNFAVTTSP